MVSSHSMSSFSRSSIIPHIGEKKKKRGGDGTKTSCRGIGGRRKRGKNPAFRSPDILRGRKKKKKREGGSPDALIRGKKRKGLFKIVSR